MTTIVDCNNIICNGIKIHINPPTSQRQYYFIQTDNSDEWVHKINIASCIKKISYDKIIELIKYNLSHVVEKSNDIDEIEMHIRENNKNINLTLINEFVNIKKNMDKKIFDVNLDNNDIGEWNIIMRSFTSCKLKDVTVTIHMSFNQTEYPNKQPIINSIFPHFTGYLNVSIMRYKMLNKTYWKSGKPIKNIIEKIYQIINDIGVVSHDSTIPQQYLTQLETLEIILGFPNQILKDYHDDINEHETLEYQKQPEIIIINNKFIGDVSTTLWNMNKYIAENNEKYNELEKITGQFLSIIHNDNDFCIRLTKTHFYDCVAIILKEITDIYVEKYMQLYINICKILTTIPVKLLINEYERIINGRKFIEIILHACKTLNKISNCIGNEQFIAVVKELQNIIDINYVDKQSKSEYLSNMTNGERKYIEIMSHYTVTEGFISDYFYENEIKNTILPKKVLITIMTELISLKDNLPISRNSSIFVKTDVSNIGKMRALIIGPKNTPYENGCFIFDIYIPANYPQECPKIQFLNHFGVMMNPNLYDNGKICLSLIGTFGDHKNSSEYWNPETSNILQLLLSIQSQILVENPFFNNPQYCDFVTDSKYISHSKKYNANIKLYTVQNAIINLLTSPNLYSEMKEIIATHLRLNKNEINKTYSANDYNVGFYKKNKKVVMSLK